MNLLENVKNFLKIDNKNNLSNNPDPSVVDFDLESIPIGFFDEGGIYGFDIEDRLSKQKLLINTYRELSSQSDVSRAINIIIDEVVFNPYNNNYLTLDFIDDKISKGIQAKMSETLQNIELKLNLSKNFYSLVKQFYIDGQLNILLQYDKNIKKGIQGIKALNPNGLYFDNKTNKWKYNSNYTDNTYLFKGGDLEFSYEEIIHINSNMYYKNVILGYLQPSLKTANMLKTLEDMLIPLRYNRSVSRRAFKVDVGDINFKKAKEILDMFKKEYKYKKVYDPETGEIKHQNRFLSLVEDYWFTNREGSRGTEVDILDEKGNLGEIEDILYIRKKLYDSLHIPSDRVGDGKSEISATFDFGNDSTNVENINFWNYVNRIKYQFMDLFYEIFKRELIAKNIISNKDYEQIKHSFKIKYVNDNIFYENLEKEKLQKQVDLWGSLEGIVGKTISYKTAYKKVFNYSDDDIEKLKKEIEEEKNDPFFKQFYENGEDF